MPCLLAVAAPLGCGDSDGLRTFEGKASCEQTMDHIAASCPSATFGRLDAITDCERDRREYEPMGCGRAFADHMLCLTSPTLDCQAVGLGCDAYRLGVKDCVSDFEAATGCSRGARHHDAAYCEAGMAGESTGDPALAFAFDCRDVPDHCERRPAPDDNDNDPRVAPHAHVCCAAFVDDSDAHFEPFEPGPEDLPPDHGDVDFSDQAQCVEFAEGQGWGTCERSVGCECANCADEVMACAAVYSCLVSRKASLGVDAPDINEDPFFTGYGAASQLEDAIEDCMRTADCESRCPQ